jgi:hypothetical protein
MSHAKTLIAFAIAASALSLNATAADLGPKIYGMAAPATTAARSIAITPDTRFVNVINGETITFRINGQTFTWTFQLYQQEGALALSAILPKELHADGVTVYVAPDSSYR